MAEQAGGGTGERVLNPAIGRPGNPGLRSVRRPGAWLATGTRAASGLRPGAISPCQELADGAGPPSERCGGRPGPKGRTVADQKGVHQSRKARPDAVRKTPQQGAERRTGGRSRRSSRAIPRWALPRGGPRVRRIRTSACRRSAPSFFSERSRRRQRGTRPLPTGRRSVGYSASFRGRVKRGARNP
jgi:hypothetical protein